MRPFDLANLYRLRSALPVPYDDSSSGVRETKDSSPVNAGEYNSEGRAGRGALRTTIIMVRSMTGLFAVHTQCFTNQRNFQEF